MLRHPSQLKIPELMGQRMWYNFRKAGSSTCKTVNSSQNNVTLCGDQNNSDSDCIIIDAVTSLCSPSATQTSGPGQMICYFLKAMETFHQILILN